ncbi:MAG TPA: hypothetical protein V6C84_18840 [Coleofasciculaceae cyanobacterium]
MNEEQIAALIASAVAEARTEILSQVTLANQGLAASLTREIKKISTAQPAPLPAEDAPEEQSKLTLKALQQQIQTLQQGIADEQNKTKQSQQDAAISSLVATSNALNPAALKKLFALNYQDKITQENGAYFVQNGDEVVSLDQAFQNYLKTDEGACFLPASNVNGSDSRETKAAPTLPTQEPASLLDAATNLQF